MTAQQLQSILGSLGNRAWKLFQNKDAVRVENGEIDEPEIFRKYDCNKVADVPVCHFLIKPFYGISIASHVFDE